MTNAEHAAPRFTFAVLSAAAALFFAGSPVAVAAQAASDQANEETAPSGQQWLDDLDSEDRRPLEALVGYAPPSFSDDLRWHNVKERPNWQGLREKVVIIQSWTSGRPSATESLNEAVKVAEQFADTDVQLIALHTPEGASEAREYLKKNGVDVPVVVDEKGEFCDDLGVFRRPVNLVIDRNGAVRFVGLTPAGLRHAVDMLIDELYDPSKCPDPLPDAQERAEAAFPPAVGSVGSARDVRGEQGPPFQVARWISEPVETEDRVVMVVFWATWCGPCIRSIPHLNMLAERFGHDVSIIGISNEQAAQFDQGLTRRNLGEGTFKYAIANDPGGRMQTAVGARGIPHSIVLCSDWVVRWQGHPMTLNEAVLRQIVEASSGGTERPRRWASL